MTLTKKFRAHSPRSDDNAAWDDEAAKLMLLNGNTFREYANKDWPRVGASGMNLLGFPFQPGNRTHMAQGNALCAACQRLKYLIDQENL